MKKKWMVAAAVVCMTGLWVVPAFAHHGNGSGCRGYSRNYNYESCAAYSCQEYCEGGIQCGTDGHYCEQHRDGGYCAGNGCADTDRCDGPCYGQGSAQGCHHGC